MEEILASIRRIIEDSEPLQADDREGEAGSAVASFREELRPAATPAIDTEDADRRAREAISADSADETPAEPETPRDIKDEPAFSSRETAEPFNALRMEPVEGGMTTTPDEGGNQEPRKAMHLQPPFEDGTTADSATAMSGTHGSESKTPSRQKPEDAAGAVREPAEAEKREEQTPLAPPTARAKSGAQETRTSILSEDSGRKVAAAFGELNEAYEASRRKSLADAAEEMLQPMLQEWLDNNLPQLVERLVREEIERIARGSSEDGQSGR